MVLNELTVSMEASLGRAIIAACRKTLPFRVTFTVEGILRVEMDRESMYVVNLNETVKIGRGRPKKCLQNTVKVVPQAEVPPVRKKRGRPKKKVPVLKLSVNEDVNNSNFMETLAATDHIAMVTSDMRRHAKNELLDSCPETIQAEDKMLIFGQSGEQFPQHKPFEEESGQSTFDADILQKLSENLDVESVAKRSKSITETTNNLRPADEQTVGCE